MTELVADDGVSRFVLVPAIAAGYVCKPTALCERAARAGYPGERSLLRETTLSLVDGEPPRG
jgi:hypothetical protein